MSAAPTFLAACLLPTPPRRRRLPGARAAMAAALLAGLSGCASLGSPPDDGLRYRLQASGMEWRVNGEDAVFADVQARYPDFFATVLDPSMIDDEPPRGDLVEDLERHPPDRASYDALNAVAIAYFEMNWRGERAREDGEMDFLAAGFACAKLAGIPWRAYSEIQDPRLRSAILDFFEDVVDGEKRGTHRTRGRLERIVADLRPKETVPELRTRIDGLVLRYREALASGSPIPSRRDAPRFEEGLDAADEEPEPDEAHDEGHGAADEGQAL